jgi:hypothetical protein
MCASCMCRLEGVWGGGIPRGWCTAESCATASACIDDPLQTAPFTPHTQDISTYPSRLFHNLLAVWPSCAHPERLGRWCHQPSNRTS